MRDILRTVRQLSNPIRLIVSLVGLVRVGLIERARARRTTDLAWPRIVTGLARMSKNAVDVAMVGVAIGTSAIAGVGFATPYWGLAFAIGGGVASGTIALVSQSYGAGNEQRLAQAVRSSVLLVLVLTLPVAVLSWFFAPALIGLLSNDPTEIELGARYLSVMALSMPFVGINLIGSRTLVGADD